MKKLIISIHLAFCIVQLSAQNHYARFKSIDVLHYIFEIHLNDSTDYIKGKANVLARFLQPANSIELDLVSFDSSSEKGMEVSSVEALRRISYYRHEKNKLNITFADSIMQNETVNIQISYSGIPNDGLIISTNKFGDRTFFGDNWPDRAHNWLPCVDHPSDKATVEFRVYAPERYQVISNGTQMEETNLENAYKLSRWQEMTPIATKLMVVGIARFAVLNNGNVNGTPVSTWVFPQNKNEGFTDYAVGREPIAYFSELIGPYSYEKLAHVQSKTRYGGMENASCIFYAERTVNGKNNNAGLIAHETTHQWFGNSVTEQNWHHIWLSEGFATYLTHFFMRNKFGDEVFKEGLASDRRRVIRYAERNFAPIIDTTVTNYSTLVNPNSYQKASWFIHMLNEELGDSLFLSGLRLYYLIYRDSTALTKDFQRVMETVSNRNLDSFFHEWLYQPGYPKIKTDWKRDKDKTITLNISQIQENYLFHFPLEIEFVTENGESFIRKFEMDDWKKAFSFKTVGKVSAIRLDPNVKLLFEEVH